MIIPKAEKLQPTQLKEIEGIAQEFECSILEINGRNRCVYAILGDENMPSCSRGLQVFPTSAKSI